MPVRRLKSSADRSLMSVHRGMLLPNLFRRTRMAYGFCSTWPTVWNPAHSAARSIPPIPVNRERCVRSFMLLTLTFHLTVYLNWSGAFCKIRIYPFPVFSSPLDFWACIFFPSNTLPMCNPVTGFPSTGWITKSPSHLYLLSTPE